MKRLVIIAGGLVLAMVLVGWGKQKQYGAPVDPNAPVVTLKEITKNPIVYKDQEVVLQGNYGFYCCPSDFSYKEGLEIVNVAPQGFDSPKLKTGQPIMLYGIVRTGKAPEEEAETKGAGKPEASHETVEFHIEAKGVALR